MPLAARVADWLDRWGVLASPSAGPAFPDVPLDVSVAIRVDDSWIDITPSVFGGNRAQVQITRGRADEAGQVDRSRATFQVNNAGGQFSPRNPTSWLYGKIGRNTAVRIAIGAGARFSGEISEWPQRWDTTGRDVWTPVEASGILRRLTQGATPLKSTLYRGYTRLATPPKAYWPCEDGADATSIASALGGKPMRVTFGSGGTTPASFSSFADFRCSSPIPTLGNTEWLGAVPAYVGTGNVQVFFLLHVATGAATVGQDIVNVYIAGGNVWFWRLSYAASDGGLRVEAFDSDGTVILDSGVIGYFINDKLIRVDFNLRQNGADVDWSLNTYQVNAQVIGGTGGTLAGRTISRCSAVRFNIGGDLGTDVAVGHVSVHSEVRSLSLLIPEVNAYAGERAGTRIARLCAEEGVALAPVGDLAATTRLGYQLPRALVDLLREAAASDGGILYEPREPFGLAYRTRESMYRQAARLALDYAAAHLSGIEPTDDDRLVSNDITVQRIGGSSAQATQDAGALSIAAPPAGVGRYDEEVSLSLQADSQLPDVAGWLLLLGTVDEARYPVLSVDLTRAPYIGTPLAAAVRALDVGDRLTVANPPPWLPPDLIMQLAQGFTEILGNFTHRIDVNCAPESPWSQPAVYSDGVSRYTSNGSTLAVGIDATATSLSVATPGGPLWSHADGDFDIMVGGERMTVTNVAGSSSPQTFTCTRSVNGVVKAHLANEAVELAPSRVWVP